MNDAAEETERFSNVIAVAADVLPGGLRILPYPVLDIRRLAENVSGVTGLWHLNDHCLFEIEDVFIAEHIHCPSTFVEMLVVIRVVIGTPVDLCDIKIAGQTLIPTEPPQFITFRRDFLDVGAQTVDLFPVLAEARVGAARFEDLLFEIIRNGDFRPARKRGFTFDQLPFAAAFPIVA